MPKLFCYRGMYDEMVYYDLETRAVYHTANKRYIMIGEHFIDEHHNIYDNKYKIIDGKVVLDQLIIPSDGIEIKLIIAGTKARICAPMLVTSQQYYVLYNNGTLKTICVRCNVEKEIIHLAEIDVIAENITSFVKSRQSLKFKSREAIKFGNIAYLKDDKIHYRWKYPDPRANAESDKFAFVPTWGFKGGIVQQLVFPDVDHDTIYLLDDQNQIWSYHPEYRYSQVDLAEQGDEPIPITDILIKLIAITETLYFLTNSGVLYYGNLNKYKWSQELSRMNFQEAPDDDIKLVQMISTPELICMDDKGRLYCEDSSKRLALIDAPRCTELDRTAFNIHRRFRTTKRAS